MTELAEVLDNTQPYAILTGHALDVLKTIPDESVHMAWTSPPYWGLRDYGLEPQVWGGEECRHQWGRSIPGGAKGGSGTPTDKNNRGEGYGRGVMRGNFCEHCGAWRGALGLEPTPELYVHHLVEIFREVRRVLRPDGTVWLNLGDCYASQGGPEPPQTKWAIDGASNTMNAGRSRKTPVGLKPKDLVGVPWMTAFALRNDGWWLRSGIVWEKPNALPSSVHDRPTMSHEFVFLLTNNATYFYDQDAIREPHTTPITLTKKDKPARVKTAKNPSSRRLAPEPGEPNAFHPLGRNKRTVWTIPTHPFPEAHFAVAPEKLIEPAILAGTSGVGYCAECGSPWKRVVKRDPIPEEAYLHRPKMQPGNNSETSALKIPGARRHMIPPLLNAGWTATCQCGVEAVPGIVLDPFAGAGTVGVVAIRHGRRFIGIDLGPEYVKMATKRIEQTRSQVVLF